MWPIVVMLYNYVVPSGRFWKSMMDLNASIAVGKPRSYGFIRFQQFIIHHILLPNSQHNPQTMNILCSCRCWGMAAVTIYYTTFWIITMEPLCKLFYLYRWSSNEKNGLRRLWASVYAVPNGKLLGSFPLLLDVWKCLVEWCKSYFKFFSRLQLEQCP